jgi:hypothetical protein
MLPPDRVWDMLEYRAYLIGRDGHIVHRVDMLCADDDAAKERALLLVDGYTVELWQGTRKVATFPTRH